MIQHLTNGQRIYLLREFMNIGADCDGLEFILVIADATAPRISPTGKPLTAKQREGFLRREVFRTLLWEFDAALQKSGKKGHVWLDENKVGAIIQLSKDLSPKLLHQPLAPIAVKSHDFEVVQLADVCAYFMLQRYLPNTVVQGHGAGNAIDDLARVCPDPLQSTIAHVREV